MIFFMEENMKKIGKILFLMFEVSLTLFALSCDRETKDRQAPAEVSGFTLEAKDSQAVLTWTNPDDKDFAGTKLSMTPAAGNLTEEKILETSVTTFTVSGLTTGSTYTFTIKTFDQNGNESGGVTKPVFLELYRVGDIILTDKSKVDVLDVENYTIDEKNKPVGVVAYLKSAGSPMILGLQVSSSPLQWASGTTGINTLFTGIQANISGYSTGDLTFTGDEDGSDNWDYIKSIDTEGTDSPEEIAKNYPAFNFALNYGKIQGYTGVWANGWYMLAIAELYKISQNKDLIQTSLTKVYGFNFNEDFHSSSQVDYAYSANYVFCPGTDTSSFPFGLKHNYCFVLVLHSLPN